MGRVSGGICRWRDRDRVSGGTDGSGKWRDMSVERPVIG